MSDVAFLSDDSYDAVGVPCSLLAAAGSPGKPAAPCLLRAAAVRMLSLLPGLASLLPIVHLAAVFHGLTS